MQIFEIGQTVWVGKIDWLKSKITCPVCNGNKVATVVFGDGTQVEVECGYCNNSDPYTYKACGWVWEEDYVVAGAHLDTITGVDVRKGDDGELDITYWFGCNGGHPDNIGATREEAVAKAEVRAALYAQQRIEKTEKDKQYSARSYTYNAKYYLERAKQAHRDVEFYERKAKIMQEKARPRKVVQE